MTASGAPPNVVALPLEEALEALQSAGWQVRLRESAPPRSIPADGLRRVVRQRARAPREVELVVVWERYTPAPRPTTAQRAPSEGAGYANP